MVKKEQVITINLPFGEGENREAQGMVAGGTGVMSCCLGQPVRQLPALLHCVQCEDRSSEINNPQLDYLDFSPINFHRIKIN